MAAANYPLPGRIGMNDLLGFGGLSLAERN
jgi:hypothetical protein